MRRYFSFYPGTGSFYVIIAKNNNMSSAYVPIYTYGCDDCGGIFLIMIYLQLKSFSLSVDHNYIFQNRGWIFSF